MSGRNGGRPKSAAHSKGSWGFVGVHPNKRAMKFLGIWVCLVQICEKIQPGSSKDETSAKILALRVLLTSLLILAAAACSVLAYFLLRSNETYLFESQYASITDSALGSFVDSFHRMNLGLTEMSSIYSHTFPNANTWPNVAWPGFQHTAQILGELSSLDNIAFSPLVWPENSATYEAFISNYYLTDPSVAQMDPAPTLGITLGMVWALQENLLPYHDVTGYSPSSPNALLAPAAQYTYSQTIGPSFTGFNIHADPRFGPAMDMVMECVASNNVTVATTACGAISEAVTLPFANYFNPNPIVTDIQAQLVHPIFPADNATTLVGFMSGAISWRAVLLKAVPSFVTGLDCVINTDAQDYTYTIIDGLPVFRGKGDLHDRSYSHYRKSSTLDTSHLKIMSKTQYTINFYPREAFVAEYTSEVPIWAAVFLVLVFFFCAVVFLTYDIIMHREFGRKQAVLDTKRRFVRFISHEIRTPLNTIRLGLKLFEVELENVTKTLASTALVDLPALIGSALDGWQRLVEDVLLNSESAVEVLDDLLNYDKIEVGALRLEFTTFSVWELIRKTTSIMQIQAQQKNITLELKGDIEALKLASGAISGKTSIKLSNGTVVVGDVYRMGQVLRNLISNALKFTPANGSVTVTANTLPDGMPEVTLPAQAAQSDRFTTLKRAGSIRIAVKDSGAGLTPQQLAEICAEGVQFNANQLQAGQGSGLGLFISKGIVEQHGGTLTVTSDGLGKGVTFTLELPLYFTSPDGAESVISPRVFKQIPVFAQSIESAVTPTARHVHATSGLTATLSRSASAVRRMLVVDDSPFNRKMLVRLLTSKGYICEQAEDGQIALEKYSAMREKQGFDAVLMDFEMPVMNGPTATKKLRELGCTALIVGVTGNVLPDEVAFFKQHGADNVLPKPLVLEDFEDLLSNYLENRRHVLQPEDQPASMLRRSFTNKSERTLHYSAGNTSQVHPFEMV